MVGRIGWIVGSKEAQECLKSDKKMVFYLDPVDGFRNI